MRGARPSELLIDRRAVAFDVPAAFEKASARVLNGNDQVTLVNLMSSATWKYRIRLLREHVIRSES